MHKEFWLYGWHVSKMLHCIWRFVIKNQYISLNKQTGVEFTHASLAGIQWLAPRPTNQCLSMQSSVNYSKTDTCIISVPVKIHHFLFYKILLREKHIPGRVVSLSLFNMWFLDKNSSIVLWTEMIMTSNVVYQIWQKYMFYVSFLVSTLVYSWKIFRPCKQQPWQIKQL